MLLEKELKNCTRVAGLPPAGTLFLSAFWFPFNSDSGVTKVQEIPTNYRRNGGITHIWVEKLKLREKKGLSLGVV